MKKTIILISLLIPIVCYGQVIGINDLNVKSSVSGSEKIPVSGSGRPAITPNLLKPFIFNNANTSTQVFFVPDSAVRKSSLFVGNGGQFLNYVNGTDSYDVTGVGFGAGYSNTRGYRNVFVGGRAAYNNTTGSNNTAVGFESMLNTTIVAQGTSTPGSNNTAVGAYSLADNQIGQGNTAMGAYSLRSTTGERNTGIGYHSLYGITTGEDNTGIGHDVALNVTTGSDNTFVGRATGAGITTGSNNTIIGANVSGLSSGLTGNVILADGAGAIRARWDGTNWVFSGGLQLGTALTASYGGTGNSALTTGSVPFIGTSGQYIQDNSNLFWDNSSKRLGIGTSTVLMDLHISKSSNGVNGAYFMNASTGTAAQTSLLVGASPTGGAYGQFTYYGTNHTPTVGYNQPNSTLVANNSGGGLNVVARGSSNPGLGLWCGDTTTPVVLINNSKNLSIGTEGGAITASTRVDIRGVSSGHILRLADNSNTQKFNFRNSGMLEVDKTVTTGGTTGNQTINKIAGSVNFAAAASSITVTNSLVGTGSLVFVQVYGNDATATTARVTVASGSFTIDLNAAATAETKVAFWVVN